MNPVHAYAAGRNHPRKRCRVQEQKHAENFYHIDSEGNFDHIFMIRNQETWADCWNSGIVDNDNYTDQIES